MRVIGALLTYTAVLVVLGNVLLCACIVATSIDDKLGLFRLQYEITIDLFEGRNAFGFILCVLIFIAILPALILSALLHLFASLAIDIWNLGKKK